MLCVLGCRVPETVAGLEDVWNVVAETSAHFLKTAHEIFKRDSLTETYRRQNTDKFNKV